MSYIANFALGMVDRMKKIATILLVLLILVSLVLFVNADQQDYLGEYMHNKTNTFWEMQENDTSFPNQGAYRQNINDSGNYLNELYRNSLQRVSFFNGSGVYFNGSDFMVSQYDVSLVRRNEWDSDHCAALTFRYDEVPANQTVLLSVIRPYNPSANSEYRWFVNTDGTIEIKLLGASGTGPASYLKTNRSFNDSQTHRLFFCIDYGPSDFTHNMSLWIDGVEYFDTRQDDLRSQLPGSVNAAKWVFGASRKIYNSVTTWESANFTGYMAHYNYYEISYLTESLLSGIIERDMDGWFPDYNVTHPLIIDVPNQQIAVSSVFDYNLTCFNGNIFYINDTMITLNQTTGNMYDVPGMGEIGDYQIEVTCGNGTYNHSHDFQYSVIAPTPLISHNATFVNYTDNLQNSFNVTAGFYDDFDGPNITSLVADIDNGECVNSWNVTSGNYFNATFTCTGTGQAIVNISFTDSTFNYTIWTSGSNSYPYVESQITSHSCDSYAIPQEGTTTILECSYDIFAYGGNSLLSEPQAFLNLSSTTVEGVCTLSNTSQHNSTVDCDFTMQYYYPAGFYDLGAYIYDGLFTKNQSYINKSVTEYYELSASTFDSVIEFDVVAGEESLSAIIINNTGNKVFDNVTVTGYDLIGEVIGYPPLNVSYFSVNSVNNSGSAEDLIDGSSVQVPGMSISLMSSAYMYLFVNLPGDVYPQIYTATWILNVQ